MSLMELIRCGGKSTARAGCSGATEAALELLEREPMLAQEVRATDGAMPLHMSLIHGSDDVLVLRLLQLHPEAARHPDKNSNRPINIAMQNERSNVVVSKLLAA